MEYSYPKRKPNPSFLIALKENNRELLFLVQEGATKTRCKQIVVLKDNQTKESNVEFFHRFINDLYLNEECPCL